MFSSVTSGNILCSFMPRLRLPCVSIFFSSIPRKSFESGSASEMSLSIKSHILGPRIVAIDPTAAPCRTLKLAISGLNLVKRHMRPKQSGQKGQIVSVERLVSASAVALVNKETGKFVRVGWQHDASGGKIRIDRKTKLPL